mmetsp:Transcript_110880/g.357956  ORF Transcript_110880/g.357956 Transcript_110880/m.357956 type:complete len:281 (-) Transcript_110880:2-844(-)
MAAATCHKEAAELYGLNDAAGLRWHQTQRCPHAIAMRHKKEVPPCHGAPLQVRQEAAGITLPRTAQVLGPPRPLADSLRNALDTSASAKGLRLLSRPHRLRGLRLAQDRGAEDLAERPVHHQSRTAPEHPADLHGRLDAAEVRRRDDHVDACRASRRQGLQILPDGARGLHARVTERRVDRPIPEVISLRPALAAVECPDAVGPLGMPHNAKELRHQLAFLPPCKESLAQSLLGSICSCLVPRLELRLRWPSSHGWLGAFTQTLTCSAGGGSACRLCRSA